MSEEQPAEVQTPVETPVAEVAESKAWLNEDGGFNREAFGELGDHGYFDKYANVEEAVKGGINAQKLISQKVNEWVNSDDPDIVSQRLEAAGVPKDAEGYDFNLEIPEGLPVSQERIDASKTVFKELGIPKAAAEKLIAWDIENASTAYNAQIEQMEVAKQESVDALKGDWKNDYDNNVEKVGNLLDHLGLSELKDDPAYGSNPAFIKAAFDKLVPLVENDSIIEARQSQTLATVEDSLNAIEDQIMEWPQHELHTTEYNRLVAKRGQLLEKLG